MIDHKIDDQIKITADHIDIFPGAEGRIDLIIGDRRKPPVSGRRIKGQQVKAADGPAEITPQDIVQFDQIAAKAVRICDQLNLVLKGHRSISFCMDCHWLKKL